MSYVFDDGKPDANSDAGGGYKFVDEPGGFKASAKQIIGSTIKGAGQAAADYLPFVGQDNPVKRYGQSVVEANPTAIQDFPDILEKPWTAVKEAAGNAAPSMAGMVGARAAGMGITAAAPLAGPLAPVVAAVGQGIAWLGPIAIAALPSYSGIRDKQILNDPLNQDDAKSKAIAALGAGAVGAIETRFGPQNWALAAMTKEGRAKLAEKFASTTLAGSIGKGALTGAAVEGSEELVQNPIEQLASFEDPRTPKNIRETLFGGTMGAIGGGVFGGAAGGASRLSIPAQEPPKPQFTPHEELLNKTAETVIATRNAETKLTTEAANDRTKPDTAADQAPTTDPATETATPDQAEVGLPVKQPLAPATVAGAPVDTHTDEQLQALATSPETPANTRHAAVTALQARNAENAQAISGETGGEKQAISGVVQDSSAFAEREKPVVVNDASAAPVAEQPETRQNVGINVAIEPETRQTAPGEALPAPATTIPAQPVAPQEAAKAQAVVAPAPLQSKATPAPTVASAAPAQQAVAVPAKAQPPAVSTAATLETKTPPDLLQKPGTVTPAAQESEPNSSAATITPAQQNVGTSPQVSANLPESGTIIPKTVIPSEVSGGRSDVAKGIERPAGKILGADVRKIADANLARFAKSKTVRIADLAKAELAWRKDSVHSAAALNTAPAKPEQSASQPSKGAEFPKYGKDADVRKRIIRQSAENGRQLDERVEAAIVKLNGEHSAMATAETLQYTPRDGSPIPVLQNLASLTGKKDAANAARARAILAAMGEPAESPKPAAPVAEAAHVEDGKIEEVTGEVIRESVAKGADESKLTLPQQREFMLAELDKAIAKAKTMDEAELKTNKRNGRLEPKYSSATQTLPIRRQGDNAGGLDFEKIPGIGYVTIDVPGDGVFRVVNIKERLQALRRQASAAFKRGPKPPTAEGPAEYTKTPKGNPAELARLQAENAKEFPAAPIPEPPVSAPAEKPATTIADHLEAAAKLMREAEKPAQPNPGPASPEPAPRQDSGTPEFPGVAELKNGVYDVNDENKVSASKRKGGDEGAPASQRDLFAESEVSRKESPQPPLVVGTIQRGVMHLGFDRLDTPEKAANAFAALRKAPFEKFQIIVTDAADKPIAAWHLFSGTLTQTSVYPREVLTAVYMTPGAKKVWFAHNHPSGVSQPSYADENLTKAIAEGLGKDLGVEFSGHIIIAGRKAHAFDNVNTGDGRKGWPGYTFDVPPASRKFAVPIMERTIKRQKFGDTRSLNAPTAVRDYFREIRPTEPGLLLMDAQNRPLGFWPISIADMGKLRTGNVDTGAGRVIQMVGKLNPGAAIAYVPGADSLEIAGAIQNLGALMPRLDVRLLDAFVVEEGETKDRPKTVVSYAEKGFSTAAPTFMSRTTITGPGLPAADIRAHIAKITDRLSVDVPVYDSVEAAREAGFNIASDAQGFAKGDRLGLIAENISTLLEAEKTTFHELWHVGIKRITRDPDAVKAFANYNQALNRVAISNPEVRKRAKEWRDKYGADKRAQFEAAGVTGSELELRIRTQSFDEAIASIAGERRGNISRVNDVIAALQRLVRALGFDRLADWAESVTDAEVLSLIRAATQSVSKDTVAFGGVMAGEPSFSRLDQTQTAEFRKWFGQSVVTDTGKPDGKPLVVYHGTHTPTDFSAFDTRRSKAASRMGAYFSAERDIAGVFAVLKTSPSRVMPTYLSMQNPMDVRGVSREEIAVAVGLPKAAFEMKTQGAAGAYSTLEYLDKKYDLIPALKKRGYDGLIFDGGNEGDTYVAFRPEQIKSAIGNRGTFDPGDPDIMHAGAGGPFNAIQQSRGVANAVAGLFKSPSALGPVNFFNTPFHKAEMLERKGIPGYKRVFQRLQLYLNDISGFAVQAEQLMPSIMRELKGIMPKDFRAYFKGAASEADIAAIGPWLNHGTLYGGGSPLEGIVWTDDELRGNATLARPIPRGLKPLTAAQIPLYRQARAGIGQSLETSGKAVIYRHVAKYGITLDRNNSLAAVAADVIDQLDTRIEGLTDRLDKAKENAGVKFMNTERLADEIKNHRRTPAELHDLRVQWEQAKKDDAAGSQEAQNLQAEMDILQALTGKSGTIQQIANHAKALIDHGYMPLKRFGNKTVTAFDADGNTKFFGAYDGTPLTPGSANREMLRVAAEVKALHPGWRVVTGTRSEKAWKMYQGLSMDALENFLDFLDPETKAELERDKTIQEYLKNAVNDHSVLKQLIHRKGTPGFSTDVPRILASFVTSHARNASGLYHLAEAKRLVGEIPDQYGTVKDEAAELVDYVTKPGEEAAVLRSFLFFNFLGGSVAAAAINLTQTVMTTAPYLSQYTGVGKLTAAIGRAGKLAVGDPAVMTGELGKDLQRAELEGITAPQQIYHLAAMASNNPFSSDRRFRTAMAVWNGMFGAAEVFNRRIAFIAAHDIATEQGMNAINEQVRKFAESRGEDAKHFDNAYDFAADAVDQTQFIYNKANRMNAARGPIGATVMTFKTFSVSWLELLRRLPPKQQLVMLGVLMLMAGAEGLPFEEDLADAVDTLGQWLGFTTNTGKWTGKIIRETLGSEFERPILKGLGGMLPIDLHSRLGLPNLIPGTAFAKPSEIDKTRDVAEAFGPVGGIMRNFMDGLQLMARGKWDRAALQAAPKATRDFYNGAYMMATGESQDTKGRLAMTDMTAAEGLGKLIGFNPQRAAREGEARREEMLDKNLRTVRMDEIASDWADGVLRKDQDKQRAARDRLREWNRDNPELRIDGRQILRSVQERVKTARMTSQQRFLKSLPKTMRPEAREAFR